MALHLHHQGDDSVTFTAAVVTRVIGVILTFISAGTAAFIAIVGIPLFLLAVCVIAYSGVLSRRSFHRRT